MQSFIDTEGVLVLRIGKLWLYLDAAVLVLPPPGRGIPKMPVD